MKNFTLKRASEVEEIYDIRTKYYFTRSRNSLGYWLLFWHTCIRGMSYTKDLLERSRSWPKHVWAENLKDLNRYLKTL